MTLHRLIATLIPSWRFFDLAGDQVNLEFKFIGASNDKSQWRVLLPSIPTGKLSFLDSESNLRHAYFNIVDLVVNDVSQLPEESYLNYTHGETYRTLEEIASLHIKRLSKPELVNKYQFRIIKEATNELILTSREYPL